MHLWYVSLDQYPSSVGKSYKVIICHSNITAENKICRRSVNMFSQCIRIIFGFDLDFQLILPLEAYQWASNLAVSLMVYSFMTSHVLHIRSVEIIHLRVNSILAENQLNCANVV